MQLSQAKKEELDSINRNELVAECQARERRKDRCSFLDQIAQTRLRGFTRLHLIKDCIHAEEPEVTDIFDRLDSNNDQLEFLDALKSYAERIDTIHMDCVMKQLAN